jgi:hypothetical protein
MLHPLQDPLCKTDTMSYYGRAGIVPLIANVIKGRVCSISRSLVKYTIDTVLHQIKNVLMTVNEINVNVNKGESEEFRLLGCYVECLL